MDFLLLLLAVLVCTLIYFIYNGQTDRKTEQDDVPPGKRLRIVLLGKTGSGKSSLANTLLQCGKFTVGRGLRSETRLCGYQIGTLYGTPVEIVDTPGLCDTHLPDREIKREVAKSLAYAAPGPHVVLIVFRADRRFTKEEFQAYCSLKTIFGDELCSRVIIVFTGLDQLGRVSRREQMQFLNEQIGIMPKQIRTVLKEANNRYTGINNTLTSYDERRIQAMELFDQIKILVASFGGMESFFTSPLVRRVNGFKMTWVHHYMKRRNECTAEEAERAFIEMVPDDSSILELIADIRVGDLCLVM